MKELQYYFSHDGNAKDDPKCVLLIEQLGLEGYGIYWILVETLRLQENYKYPIKLIPALSRRYNTSTEKMTAVVKGYELFEIEDDLFFSISLITRMEYLENKRIKLSAGGKKAMENRYNSNQLITSLQDSCNQVVTTLEPSYNNKIKEKKRKENNIEEYSWLDSNFKEIFFTWLEYKRIQLKFTYKTEQSLKLVYNELITLSNNNLELATKIINQSMINGWKGLFAIKDINNGGVNANNGISPNKPISDYEKRRNFSIPEFNESRKKNIESLLGANIGTV